MILNTILGDVKVKVEILSFNFIILKIDIDIVIMSVGCFGVLNCLDISGVVMGFDINDVSII